MVLNVWEKELGTRNLFDFTKLTMPTFQSGWFHQKYYSKLNDFAHGRIKKLMVFVPPQHGKSEGSTRRLPAFLIGRDPNKRIAITSYSASKARKFNREIQRVIAESEYHQIFPHIKLSNGADGYTKTFDEFEIPGYSGSIKTVGVGGPLTGEPVDILIMDDIYKDWMEAQSDTIRQSKQDWYDSVADTRLHNESQQLLVFTRWHEYDLAGYLLEKEGDQWEQIIYQALKVGPPTEDDPRKEGEALYPEKHSKEKLENTKKRNEHNFEGLYQQNPTPKAGLLFPKSDLHFYDPKDEDKLGLNDPDYVFLCGDPADEGGDDFASGPFKLIGDKIYLTEVLYNTDGVDLTEPAVSEMVKRNKPSTVHIEGVMGWVECASRIRNDLENRGFEGEFRITNPRGRGKKHTRITHRSSFIRNHFVFRSDWEDFPQYAKFMRNLTSYLKIQEAGKGNKHDDAPDLCEMAADYYEKTFPHLWGMNRN